MLVAVLALAGACSRTKTLAADQLDRMIASDMQAKLHVQGVTVSCPDDVPAETGHTFTCSAANADGSTMTLEVSQTDDQGHVTYKVVGAG
jgi:uncharacterized glyoxalase superfamily protein PhnB